MQLLAAHKELFLKYLKKNLTKKQPENLYNPAKYILELGGKRIRPLLTLLSAEVFDTKPTYALNGALAIEIFHNFSLVHDDIMDKAPIRRGRQTVHKKWNTNTAILSGDAMLIWSYQLLEKYPSEVSLSLIKLFSSSAIKVCEGQQLDMDFSLKENITIIDYLKMIENKTSVLLGCALAIGAIISKVSQKDVDKLYKLGIDIGYIYQLQDDFLDAFGDSKQTGKQEGGDIIENKKTFLYIHAKENCSVTENETLKELFKTHPKNPSEKIKIVKAIFLSSGADKAIKNKINYYRKSSLNKINKLSINKEKKSLFYSLINNLINRSF